MRALSVITLLAALVLPTVALAEVQTFTTMHTYIMGDEDSRNSARQKCLAEAKRKILEQAGVFIESASEVKNFDLTKDKITSFAAAVMQVKDTKEEVSFQQGHMTLTLKLTAQVDLAEVRKQLAARQLDANVRDTVSAQQDHLKNLEARLEAMQRQMKQTPGSRTMSPVSDTFSAEDVQTVRAQATQGDRVAQGMLGNLYHLGNGVPQDYVQARQWYAKAAAQGNVVAQGNLGVTYQEGLGVPQDDAQAAYWFQKAAAQGDAGAQRILGGVYEEGKGVSQDYVQARQWYAKAAAQGDAIAQYSLGGLYATGLVGVPQDDAQAAYWFQKAAAQGNDIAQHLLGSSYDKGLGVQQDYIQAVHWYEKAAAQGNDDAQYSLGSLYDKGLGVQQDYVQAVHWHEKAAAQGNPFAQAILGMRYHSGGYGVAKDYVRSYMWSSLAVRSLPAPKGATQAQVGLALQYLLETLERTMTPQQLQEARQLVRDWRAKKGNTPLEAMHQTPQATGWTPAYSTSKMRAADVQIWQEYAAQGSAVAQFMLGYLYERGIGVPQDDVRAYMLYNLAVANSTNDAQKDGNTNSRDEIAHRMTPAQIAEAQRLTQQCQAQQFKGC